VTVVFGYLVLVETGGAAVVIAVDARLALKRLRSLGTRTR
jgi:hypothetical protein